MQQEVYADILFLINFSMDFLCLFLTSQLLHLRLYPIKSILSAIIGGVYSVTALFICAPKLIEILIDISICALMCSVGFGVSPLRFKRIGRLLCTYLCCAVALGGIMTALFNLLNRLELTVNSGGDSISSWLFLLLAAISGITAMRGMAFLKRNPHRKLTELDIYLCGKKITLKGMTDTGNMLYDPVSGRPVIVTDITSSLPLLPDPLKRAIISGDTTHLEQLKAPFSQRIRLIPGASVSGSCMLIGIVPDKISLHHKKATVESSALFAPAKISFLPPNCSAIIPSDLII